MGGIFAGHLPFWFKDMKQCKALHMVFSLCKPQDIQAYRIFCSSELDS